MNGEQTFNVNAAQCLYNEMTFGETIVHNICNDTISTVPWGGVDWAVAILFAAFLLTMIGFFIRIIFD